MTMYYSNFGTYPTVSKQLEEDLLKIIKGRDHYHLDNPDHNHYQDYQDFQITISTIHFWYATNG